MKKIFTKNCCKNIRPKKTKNNNPQIYLCKNGTNINKVSLETKGNSPQIYLWVRDESNSPQIYLCVRDER